MKQTQTFTSTYTADVSGVCSALFELGGMTVMHDASGCNSTYHTHDEPRWYDQDSLVFISGLSEMESIMGDDNKLIDDILEAASALHPRFIAIAGTPIPMMTGCDIPAIATAIEGQTGVPCFGFQTNGMHSYVSGAGKALAAYARRMTQAHPAPLPHSVNILGATPLDFSVNGAVSEMKAQLERAGWAVVGTWAMGSAPEELERAGCAAVNLVISSVGLDTAKVLREKFGTPYVIGTPFGSLLLEKLCAALERSARSGENATVFSPFVPNKDSGLYLIGESVTSRSLAMALNLAYGAEGKVICPVESEHGILSPEDRLLEDEDDIKSALAHAKEVIADPLYRPILPADCTFYPLPHEACSGRLFRKDIPNLVKHI